MHYHVYRWRGTATEYQRRHTYESHIDQAAFARSPVPPLKACWWLRKPAEAAAGTYNTAHDAARWLAAEYRAVADTIAVPGLWTADRQEHAARDLADGRDITWSWSLEGDRRAFASAVACSPNRWDPDAACPLRDRPRHT
ncbi:hypothetical protein LG943_19300 [Streptomonospora sp. S1-112]|uniref:Uncharacterized protein n=1 Tax=Streptomonospora mangrovi TaxID=2883123 RepID=A0A9X3SIM2_9ACTN|nr:hypothetical protein [Streptomonospora mangrovi]MDA0566444.1 hypothetical protein [Streptomonospora mangrovi]